MRLGTCRAAAARHQHGTSTAAPQHPRTAPCAGAPPSPARQGGRQRAVRSGWQRPLLTGVGDGEAVGHLQVVDVGSQPELRGGKLNHPYPKGAVLLIGAPREQPPCREIHTHVRRARAPAEQGPFPPPGLSWARMPVVSTGSGTAAGAVPAAGLSRARQQRHGGRSGAGSTAQGRRGNGGRRWPLPLKGADRHPASTAAGLGARRLRQESPSNSARDAGAKDPSGGERSSGMRAPTDLYAVRIDPPDQSPQHGTQEDRNMHNLSHFQEK